MDECAKGALNELHMYRDVNVAYDAWEIGRMYEQVPVELGKDSTLNICSRKDGCILRSTGEKSILLGSRRSSFGLIVRKYSSTPKWTGGKDINC